MQGKAENYMATAINTAGCLLALKGYGGLAVCCWAAGVAWKRKLEGGVKFERRRN